MFAGLVVATVSAVVSEDVIEGEELAECGNTDVEEEEDGCLDGW